MSDHLIAEANRHARALTIERDQIRTELALLREWQREVIQNANAHHAERREALARAELAEAEVERLGHLEAVLRSSAADMTAGSITAGCVADLRAENERLRRAYVRPDDIRAQLESAIARAERAEAAETVALAKWNGALERAMKAEADLVALAQCHDDNCRALVKIAAELAAERARLDWLLLDNLTRFDDSFSHRTAIDAAMKEDAK